MLPLPPRENLSSVIILALPVIVLLTLPVVVVSLLIISRGVHRSALADNDHHQLSERASS